MRVSFRQSLFFPLIGTFIAAIFLSTSSARSVPENLDPQNEEIQFPSTADLLMRPWVLDWRGEWMRRLSPRMGQYGWKYGGGMTPRDVGPGLMRMEKKWSRLEPSIRFL